MSIIQKSNYGINNNLFIKREDLIPLYFGGNKVRIAEAYFNNMKEKQCNCIVAYGNSRSNLCRAISQICAAKGIECYVISPNDNNGERVETNNSMIVNLMGAKIITCEKSQVCELVENTIDMLKDKGLSPYYIYGDKHGKGNENVGTNAYIEVYKEILEYQNKNNIKFDYIFLASGTGTTQSGLICGKYLLDGNSEIIGISIARECGIGEKIIRNNVSKYINSKFNDKIYFVDDYLLEGYGYYNREIIKCIKDVFKADSIALDTTYTGKAFWGMTKYLKDKNIINKNILFIHTGSVPLFFDKLDIIGDENDK